MCTEYSRAEAIAQKKKEEMKEIEALWKEIADKLTDDVGKELSDEIIKAFGELYSLFNTDTVKWFANLYEAKTGGFYYSNSARDTALFRPDLESTYQTLQFMRGSGMCRGLTEYETVPEWMSRDIVRFTKSLQDPNGYFYHPQWGKKAVDERPARRGRDLTWGERILKRFNSSPTYDTPSGVKGDGVRYDGTKIDLTQSAYSEQSENRAPVTAVAEHLSSKEKFLEYLAKWDVERDGYYVGNLFESQATQINARDEQLAAMGADYRLADLMEEFFNAHQNKKTGLWTPYDEADYLGINGLLKIGNAYHKTGKMIPNAVAAFKSAMQIITSEVTPTTVCFVLNPWYAMISIIDNIEKCYPAEDREAATAQVQALRREMLMRAPELIRATAKKVALFRKADGSFSYMPHTSGPNSQGLPVAIYGTNEGDVNATYILTVATTSHIFTIFGYKLIPLFTPADRDMMLDIIEQNKRKKEDAK